MLDDQRLHVSRAEALPQLAVLGIACGLLAALVMIAFRMVIELSQAALLPPGGPENYEALPPEARLLLPIVGALASSRCSSRCPTSPATWASCTSWNALRTTRAGSR